MSRTTLILDSSCLDSVRELSARERKTMSQLVTELIVEGLQRRKNQTRVPAKSLPTFAMGLPTVNLADRDFHQFRDIKVMDPTRPEV